MKKRDLGRGDLLILTGDEVASLLKGQEQRVIEVVAQAYKLHTQGQSSLPHSIFLRFPDNQTDRIIGLPAYLGGDFHLAGMKWIASFPANVTRGMDRASALIALNSATTGRPTAVMEASIISASRTAASAALAGRRLMAERKVERVGFIGCGLINFEFYRFLRAGVAPIRSLVLFDLAPERAREFAAHCEKIFGELEIEIAADLPTVLRKAPLVSFATTAGVPYVDDISACAPGSAILHLSLRDLSPEVILRTDNVVDDLDHIARANTSIHLTELRVGHRDFVRCCLGDILLDRAPARKDEESIAVFSPFGLGVLDLAVAQFVEERASAENGGTFIESFLPLRWTERS